MFPIQAEIHHPTPEQPIRKSALPKNWLLPEKRAAGFRILALDRPNKYLAFTEDGRGRMPEFFDEEPLSSESLFSSGKGGPTVSRDLYPHRMDLNFSRGEFRTDYRFDRAELTVQFSGIKWLKAYADLASAVYERNKLTELYLGECFEERFNNRNSHSPVILIEKNSSHKYDFSSSIDSPKNLTYTEHPEDSGYVNRYLVLDSQNDYSQGKVLVGKKRGREKFEITWEICTEEIADETDPRVSTLIQMLKVTQRRIDRNKTGLVKTVKAPLVIDLKELQELAAAPTYMNLETNTLVHPWMAVRRRTGVQLSYHQEIAA